MCNQRFWCFIFNQKLMELYLYPISTKSPAATKYGIGIIIIIHCERSHIQNACDCGSNLWMSFSFIVHDVVWCSKFVTYVGKPFLFDCISTWKLLKKTCSVTLNVHHGMYGQSQKSVEKKSVDCSGLFLHYSVFCVLLKTVLPTQTKWK